MKKTETKNRDAQKKRSSHKAVESVLRAGGKDLKIQSTVTEKAEERHVLFLGKFGNV